MAAQHHLWTTTRIAGFLVCMAVSLTACSRLEGFPKPQLVAEPDGVTARLAAAADRAANALDELAAIENTRTPTDIPPLVSGAPVELRRAITVDWVGSAEPLVRQLADRASYQFKMSGQPPAVPMVVTLRVRNEPLIEVLRNLGLQLDNRATLQVDPSTQTIELVYGPIIPPPITSRTMQSMTSADGRQFEFATESPAIAGPAMPIASIASETLATPTAEDASDALPASPF